MDIYYNIFLQGIREQGKNLPNPAFFRFRSILAASDLIQALTLIIASFGLYPEFFITFEATGGE